MSSRSSQPQWVRVVVLAVVVLLVFAFALAAFKA